VDYSVLRALTHFSLVERVFCIGFARFQPPPPPPTTVTTDPSRLIYVFAGAKLSYFIIARAIVATPVCIDMPLFRRRGGFVRLGVKNSHDTSGGFYKFLSLSRLNNAITTSTLYSSRDIIFLFFSRHSRFVNSFHTIKTCFSFLRTCINNFCV